jgi:serine/threonine protein kinase/class 3 adenylate cyclase
VDTGSFELLKQRSGGRDGIVYVARDPVQGVTVDLRMLTGLAENAGRMADLKRRLQLLKLVNHPGILNCVEAVLQGDSPFVATEPAPDQSLLARGSEAFQSEPIEALKLLEKLAEIVGAAHRVGMTHGELSPLTVYLEETPRVDLLQIEDGLIGTAPDGWNDTEFRDQSEASPTPASDVFSLGAILCWLVSGAAPAGPVVDRSKPEGDGQDDSGDSVDQELSVDDLENEPPIDWSGSEQLRVSKNSLRPLLCQMIHDDELLRPTALDVARKLRGMIQVLADSVCDQTMISNPDFESTNVFDSPGSAAPKPTQLGRFVIHNELGEGGMGTVYRAEDLADGQIVAIKTLRASIAEKIENRRRFVKEGRLLAKVNSPYVTQLIEANEDNGVAFIAIEFVDGASVNDLLKKEGQLDERLALSITCDVVKALDVAHQHGIIHRDVKPDNILLSWPNKDAGDTEQVTSDPVGDSDSDSVAEDDVSESGVSESDVSESDVSESGVSESGVSESGSIESGMDEAANGASRNGEGELPRARLTDFGLARQVEQSESMQVTRAGAVLGTPLYMAPEQWTGSSEVDARTDLYSLGATLYRMLAGRPPFEAGDLAKLMSRHLNDPPPPLQKHNAAVSDGVVTIVEKTLAKDPQDRYSDAGELLEDLERLLRGEASSMVLHPQLPALADQQRFMTWEFQWDLESSPAQLWPYVSNTDRFNRAMGLPPATFRTESAPGIGVRRFGETSIGPLTLAWEEHPFEWIQGRRFGVLREFSKGPFIWFISITEMSDRPGGGTLLKHSFRIEPRGITGRIASKIQMGRQTRNSLDRLYRRIDRVAVSESRDSEDAFEVANRLKSSQRRRLDDCIGALIDAGADVKAADQLAQFLLEAPDAEVSRIRPIPLARRLNLDERLVIDVCLLAVKHGVLKLLWDILCPVCRVPSTVHETLKELQEHEHCEACNLDFEADFSESIELIFAVHPEIRATKTGTYCIGGPANFPHIVAQTRIRPGERMKWPLSLEAGKYRLRSPQLAFAMDVSVDDGIGVRRWDADLGGSTQPNPPTLSSGRQTLTLNSQMPHELLVRLERSAARDDALTAAQASSLARFRELFPNEVMAPGQLANVTRVTLLALSVGQLEAIYDSHGDSGTFAVVHECLRLADEVVRDAGGAVIRIIGEGFLAAFEEPAGAVQVALSLPSRFASSESTSGLPMRIAIHRGDAMLTTINGRLDYFGMTVNNVFELLNSAEFGDLLITQSVAADPVVADLLTSNNRHAEVIRHQQIGPRREPVQRLSVLDT